MLDIIKAAVCTLSIRDLESKNVLIFKGLYALPHRRGFLNQFKFWRVLKKINSK